MNIIGLLLGLAGLGVGAWVLLWAFRQTRASV